MPSGRLRHVPRDGQSTEKSVSYGFLSLVSVYGKKRYLWPNLLIFLTRFGYYPPPPIALRDRGILRKKNDFVYESTDVFVLSSATTPPLPTCAVLRARRVNFFGYYPKSEDFSEFRLGNPPFPYTLHCVACIYRNVCLCNPLPLARCCLLASETDRGDLWQMPSMWHCLGLLLLVGRHFC